jgi:hypothetical protein
MNLPPIIAGLAGLFAAGSAAAGVPAATGADPIRVELRDTAHLLHPGATAAFSVDPSVAEVSARGGRVTIVARSVGSTIISVVTADSIASFPLVVLAPPQWSPVDTDVASLRKWTLWQGHYESSTARLTNSLEMVDDSDQRTLRAYAVNVTRLDEPAEADLDPRTSMPAMALEWRGPRHELVLLDKTVEHSPLTLDGTTVRGLHLRAGGLQLHGGVTSPFLYQNVFLSTQREVVLGASYQLRAGRSSFTPNLYAFPTPPQTGGSDGTMGSMLYGYASGDGRLALRGELGWGGVLGAAGELSYQGVKQRAWITARHQPQGFAGLGVGRPIGSMVDAVWTGEPSKRWTLNLAGNAARHQIGEVRQEIATATAETRLLLGRGLAASTGASVGQFGGDVTAETVRSITVPAGLHLDGTRFGTSAVYRYQANSARNHGGHGGRLSMRAKVGTILHASTFVDAQQDAATLELILREQPYLAQMLNELGLTATTPDDLARLLRENATLSQLGYVEGATLDFHPWRMQAGADLAWLARDDTRRQFRLRFLFDRTQTVTGQQETRSSSLSYSRRITSAMDVTGMMSGWLRSDRMGGEVADWSIAVGARLRIDDVPRLPLVRRSKIEGVVVDEGAAGGGAPMAGVTIRLDGRHVAVSDASGRFRFAELEDGEHRVEAELPPDAYFTSASRVTVAAGGTVRFGLARAPARLSGLVRDDTGAGIGGVLLLLRGAAGIQSATTDSRGRFRFVAAEGDYLLEPAPESIPAGYDVSAATIRSIRLERATTVRSDLFVPANRSIAGTVRAARGAAPAAAARVTLVELDRTAAVDQEGRYVFRGLKPGRYTVEAALRGTTIQRPVELPAGPASLRDIDFP